MPLIATHELNVTPTDPQIYNGFDVCRTHGILSKLLSLPQYGHTYSLSRGMQGPAMEMMLRGFLIDPMERDRGLTDIIKRLGGINSALAQLVHAISGQTTGFDSRPYFFNSGPQIRHLFYDVMRIKPIEKHFRGETKLPMDEETLEKIRLRYPLARVIASAILACRDLTKQREKLEMEVDPDWRMRTSINIAGTNELRWSSSKSFTGTGGNLQNVDPRLRRMFISDPGFKLCGIDKEQAESRWVGALCAVLFDDWKYLDACESGDTHTSVAKLVWPELAWTGDMKLDRKIAEEPFHHETRRQSCKILGHGCLTEDHEVLTPTGWKLISTKPDTIMCFDKQGESKFARVSNWVDKEYSGVLIELDGKTLSIKMTEDHRVIYTTTNDEKLSVAPARRVPNSARIPLGWGLAEGNADISPEIARLIAAYQCDGNFGGVGQQIRFHMYKERKFFRLELLANSAGVPFTRTDGDRAAITVKDPGSWPKRAGPYLFSWRSAALEAYLDELIDWDGSRTKTTIDTISTTLYSVDREHLEWIQTFNRLVGTGGNIQKGPTISGFGSKVYRMQFNKRRYTFLSSLNKHYTNETTRVLCPSVSTEFFFIRRKGKISITGNTNIIGTPRTMAIHTGIPEKTVEEFQSRYFSAFPAIPQLHRWIAMKLQRDGFLVNMFNCRRDFFDRVSAPETIRSAMAFMQASPNACDINLGIYRMWKTMGEKVQLLTQEHDAVYFQFSEDDDEEEIIREAQNCLKVEIPLTRTRSFSVPTDCKTGWNKGLRWEHQKDGRLVEINPRGLDKPGARR